MVTEGIRGISTRMTDIRRYQRKHIGRRVLYGNRTDCSFWNKKLHLQYYKFQDREIGILLGMSTMDLWCILLQQLFYYLNFNGSRIVLVEPFILSAFRRGGEKLLNFR
jgi:hypothetical protein